MIIKKTILNHNFVPMYVNSIDNQILSGDKKTVNNLWAIEYNNTPIFIKPYQTAEVLLSINTAQSEWSGVVYLDSIYHSDLYDTFGTITGWDIQFKRNFSIYNFHDEPVTVPNRPESMQEIDIELSLFESGSLFKQVLQSFKQSGFDPQIEDVDVYAPWLYGVFECCKSPPITYTTYKWGTWSQGNPAQNILTPGKIIKDGDDYIYQLRMNADEVLAQHAAIRELLETSSGYTCKDYPVMSKLRQIFTPYGMVVTLNLTPKADNPYIVKYNLFNSLIWVPWKESESPQDIADTDQPFLYDHTGNILISKIGLMLVPNDVYVNTHSDEAYSFEVSVILPYSSAAPVEIQGIDISPPNGLIWLNHKSLPQTLLGNVNGLRDEFGTLEVLVNVDSGLTSDYQGDLTVSYLWDGIPKEEIISINILPDLEKFSATLINSIQFQTLIPHYILVEKMVDNGIDDLQIKYDAYLGSTDSLYITVVNVGNGNDIYKGVIYDKNKFKVKDLNPKNMVIPANGQVELAFDIEFLNSGSLNDFPFKIKTENETDPLEYEISLDALGVGSQSIDKILYRFQLNKPKLLIESSISQTKYIQKGAYTSLPFNVTVHGLSVTDIVVNDIKDTSYFLEKKYTPILEGTKPVVLDVSFYEEGLHEGSITLYTNNSYLPQVTVPLAFYVSDFNIQEDFIYDESDFYVDKNKYHLSLVKSASKTRYFKFKFLGNYPLKIEGMSMHQQKDRFDVYNLDVNILNKPEFPQTLTQNDEIMLEVEFTALEFGYTLFFFIIHTTFGDIYLPVSAFCNTKYKDVYITSKTESIVEFSSIMGGYDRQFIKLANYGDQICEVELTKLGYDKDEFLLKDKGFLSGSSVSYIDAVFLPAVTGKRSAYVDVKLDDMLNTFWLNADFTSKTVKIQASHIIYKLFGYAISEEAFPKFNHEIIDFGYINLDDLDQSGKIRYSNIEINNLGLNPYVILSATSPNPNSAFKLMMSKLPSRPSHFTEIPIMIDYSKIDGPGKYFDVFTFVIQDLKTKKEMVFNIPIKVEFTTTSEIFVAVNAELINFGLAEIGHQKSDELVIRNYSTDRIVITIDYTGDYEFTTFSPLNVGLSPNQSFALPMHFFPHGINTFTGKVVISVGAFVQEVDLIGQGVDFKAPMIYTTNKLYDFFKDLGYR